MKKIIVLLAALSAFSVSAEEIEFGTANVSNQDKTLEVEFAGTWKQRAQGLMFREALCGDCGMLFDFGERREVGMWMKNTLIPLDVAFIDEDGKIRYIAQMQPHSLRTTSSQFPVRYALEMNLGWFKENGWSVGDKVKLVTGQEQ